ncbi:hypothetical protein EsH8_VII_000176 [Colletotrichum jinshuiense]
MSGRSAYVRKKITQTEKEKARARSNTGGAIGAEYDDFVIPEFPLPQAGASLPVGTGVGTTNARFLKFSEPPRDVKPGTPSIASGSGSSADGRRDGSAGPLDDFAYARARRPTIKTEDVSGIEKSGLRSRLDKKSEDVRRGLAKTFTFKRKDKEPDFRPESVATVRPSHSQGGGGAMSPVEPEYTYEQFSMDAMQQMALQKQMQLQMQQMQMHNMRQQQHQQHQQHQQQDMDLPLSPPPVAKLPPVPTTPPIKRWIGAGRPVQRWNKLRKDPELWDPNGDVLVFFGHKGQAPRPNPSFRLSSHIIEATESRYLITLLREGTTEEDIYMPPSPQGAPPMLRPHMRGGAGGQPTPPISEDLGDADGQISYEMYFPTPANMTKTEQLRSHITTRNVFALLYHASVVGLSLHQALSDLHMRLDAYMPPDADNVGMILNYLSARGIDDVRNDPETAVSLLAWAEGPAVRWEEGWRESFLHCAGLYAQLEGCADFSQLTPITRALLERACLETQLRVQAAEERLAEFQYADMWPAGAAGPARAAADRLQKFLLEHYLRAHGSWPPPPPAATPVGADADGEDMWLTRSVAQALQRDFGALYDYLVNRDIVWDMSEARSGRKWMMQSDKDKGFDADADIPMTDMLVEHDNKLRFPHIPHPYPLVPESIPPAPAAKETSMFKKKGGAGAGAGGGLGGGSGANGGGNGGGRAGALERRVQLAYTEATNIYILGSDFTQSDLIDAFVKFEKADGLTEVDPAVARRGRWVLIYGVLQTLASVSVDAPNARYRDGVAYHLSPRLRGTRVPPWKGSGGADEASHELSHCWVVRQTWGTPNNSGAESSGGSGGTSPVHGQGLARPFGGGIGGIGGMGGMGGNGYPRAPASTTSRGSGYQTPGTRSVYSAGSAPPFSSAYSVVSESDTASSSVRTPASSRAGTNMRRAQSRDNVKGMAGGGGGPGSLRSAGTFGGDGGHARGNAPYHHEQSLPMPNGITGSGGFLALDDMVDRRGARGGGHGRSARDGSETDSVAPRIRDFDLDVIDDHEP